MVRNILVALAVAGAASPLAATPFSVRAVDDSGRSVREEVVTLFPAGNAARQPIVPGRVTLRHPLRAPGGLLQQVSVGRHSASFLVRLRPPPAAMPMTDY